MVAGDLPAIFNSNEARRAHASSIYMPCAELCGDKTIAIREKVDVSRIFRRPKRWLRRGHGRIKVRNAAQLKHCLIESTGKVAPEGWRDFGRL
jgi:hypothetical protein